MTSLERPAQIPTPQEDIVNRSDTDTSLGEQDLENLLKVWAAQRWPTADEFRESFRQQPSLAEVQRRHRHENSLPPGTGRRNRINT